MAIFETALKAMVNDIPITSESNDAVLWYYIVW